MKNAILMLAMFILTVTNAKAQSLSYGVKVGANYSNVYDSEGENFVADSKLGFAAGGFVSFTLLGIIGVQPEVLFSQKGFKSSGTYFGTTYEMTRTTNHIDAPIMVAVKPIPFITLLFGPQFSYLLSQKDDFTGGTISGTQQDDFNNDNLRKNTFGLIGGADIAVSHLIIGVRAAWDVNNNNGDGTTTTPRYKNMLYQATVGYKF